MAENTTMETPPLKRQRTSSANPKDTSTSPGYIREDAQDLESQIEGLQDLIINKNMLLGKKSPNPSHKTFTCTSLTNTTEAPPPSLPPLPHLR